MEKHQDIQEYTLEDRSVHRKLLHLTQENIHSLDIRDILTAHSDLLNRSDYFSYVSTCFPQSALTILLQFNPFPISNSHDSDDEQYIILPFHFFVKEYVDIVTWEVFESWHHVEQNSPKRAIRI